MISPKIITYAPAGGNTAVEVGKGAQTAIIANLTNGTEYVFTLKTVDASGNESAGVASAAYIPAAPNPQPGNGRYLVLYFSRSGNTRAVANEIRTQTDGTIIEVVPETAYPSDYNATLSRAQQEISAIDNNGAYPSINTVVENFDGYDMIFSVCPKTYNHQYNSLIQG